MRLDVQGIRSLVSTSILSFLLVVTVYLWFIDLLTNQRTFAVLLGAELVAFSVLIYVSTKPSYMDVSSAWILIGCIAIALLLMSAIAVQ
jgi:hypothetical protein